MTKRIINPHRYEYWLKGSAPCNYSLNSQTHFRTLAVPEDIQHAYQIEAFYKYDYGSFKIDWAFRTFEYEEEYRQFNMILVTDKGIYKEDITRSIYDNEIFMRWTTFVTHLQERKPHLFITTEYDTKRVVWFYPDKLLDYPLNENLVLVIDTEGISHLMRKTEALLKAFDNKQTDYVDVDETNFIPVYWFRMWYTMF